MKSSHKKRKSIVVAKPEEIAVYPLGDLYLDDTNPRFGGSLKGTNRQSIILVKLGSALKNKE